MCWYEITGCEMRAPGDWLNAWPTSADWGFTWCLRAEEEVPGGARDEARLSPEADAMEAG